VAPTADFNPITFSERFFRKWKILVFHQYLYNKYMLFAGREVRIGKNWALGLEYGPRPAAVLKTKGTVFPYTDRPRPANNLFIFFSLENYFLRNTFVDFLLQQFHTRRVRLTFRSSKPVLFTEVFKRRDSVFADFKTEQ